MHTPGFKVQIGSTNIMSLQQKIITPLSQQAAQGPPSMTMIQPSPITIPGNAELKRLQSSIKILKPIAPKPQVLSNYTGTVIKPAQESSMQTTASGTSSVCHHVLPFGTTIKVTAGNEQLPLAISKPQQMVQPPSLIQQQAQYQPQQQQLSQMQTIQQPQSPTTSTLLKQIRPVSPATMSAQPNSVLSSPTQNKVIINKIIYKPPEGHLGPGPTAGQPRIVAATPPLSPVSIPELKRKIIITNNPNRTRLPSPGQSPTSIPQRSTTIQPTQTQIIVQTANPTLPLPATLAAARTTIDNIPTTVQAVISSSSSSSITVTPMATVDPSPPEVCPQIQEEKAQSTVNMEPKQPDEIPESSEQSLYSSIEEFSKTLSQSSSQVDASETEVSSITTEQIMIGMDDQEQKDDSRDEEAEKEEGEMQIELEVLDSSQGSARSSNAMNSGNEKVEKDDIEDKSEDTKPQEPEEMKAPTEKTVDEPQTEDVLNDQIKSPRLQKRANSDLQQHISPVRARRLSESALQDEAPNVGEEKIPPMPKPLEITKKPRNRSASRRSRSSKSSVPSSLFCNEKLDTESDESRSVKTSASSLHTISPPKKEDTSESPPAYDQDKLQAAIDIYKKKQAIVKSHREKSRSESRSVVDREEKEEKDYIEGDFGSTPSDLIKWNDGIGYIRSSLLHFQFNQFGLVEPMGTKEFLQHVNTNVYESLKDPVGSRQSIKTVKKKRKSSIADGSYQCKGCRGRGTAGDFATPDCCSIACMKKTKKESLLLSIEYSKSLQRKGIGSSESSASNSTPLPTSDDDSLGSSLNFANAFKEKSIFPKESGTQKSTLQEILPTLESNQPKFSWEAYLSKTSATPSPLDVFSTPYPSGPNKFRIGMKLEAIDPENNSLFCVCSVVEVRGYRMKLTFDGYSRDYDFWVNADSLDIFPPGWCQKTNRVLQPPNGYGVDFSWNKYLNEKQAIPAPKGLFKHLSTTTNENKFEIGMSLEADDLKKSGKVCVASVTDKIDNRILVHFDGWDERYDFWVDIHSPYIHHIDWHREDGYNITPPPDWNKDDFEWAKYIRLKSRRIGKAIIPADQSLFATRQPMGFKPGMKLEVVDRKNQMLIRPATVVETEGYEIKVCFDGWPNFYSFWIEDDSSDIHPMNWCKRTSHPIEFPPDHRPASIKSTCDSAYCLGQGNAKFLSKSFHTRSAECPYRNYNWLLEDRRKMRLTHEQIITINSRSQVLPPEAPPIKKIKKEPVEFSLPKQPEQPARPTTQLLRSSQPSSTASNGSALSQDPLIKTALPVISDYGPRLNQSFELWKTTSRILDRCTDGMADYERNPLRWSVEDVASYVERFPGCSTVGNQIREEQINGNAFLSMTQEDLVKYLDVKLGPAIKLYNRIIHLRLQVEKHFTKF